jgi:NAD(P)H-hydrate epimerase
VTFIGTKRGLLTGDGTDMVGELYFDDLGVPVDVLKRVPATALRLSNESLAGLLPRRLRNSHKNRFGHILVVGGDQGMGGAVVMSAEAALRTGAGLVSVATHPSHAASLLSRIPELMVRGISTEADQVDSANGIEALAVMVEQCSVVVLGPGLGKSEWSREMFNTVMEVTSRNGKAMVIDADGLNLLSAGFE